MAWAAVLVLFHILQTTAQIPDGDGDVQVQRGVFDTVKSYMEALPATIAAWFHGDTALAASPVTRVLVVYSISPEASSPVQLQNARRFFDTALVDSDNVDFIVVSHPSVEIDIPEQHNVKAVMSSIRCHDFAFWGAGLRAEDRAHSHYIFISSSMDGPHMLPGSAPSAWVDAFTAKMSSTVRLVGPLVSCYNHPAYIASGVWATDSVGRSLAEAADVFRCGTSMESAKKRLLQRTFALSDAIRDAGYNLAGLTHAQDGVDWRNPANFDCYNNIDPTLATIGSSLVEMVFVPKWIADDVPSPPAPAPPREPQETTLRSSNSDDSHLRPRVIAPSTMPVWTGQSLQFYKRSPLKLRSGHGCYGGYYDSYCDECDDSKVAIAVETPRYTAFDSFNSLPLRASVAVDCNESTWTAQWTQDPAPVSTLPAGASVVLPAYALPPGATYVFTINVTVSTSGRVFSKTASVSVTVARNPLIAVIDGPYNRTRGRLDRWSLVGSTESGDADYPDRVARASFAWSCSAVPAGAACPSAVTTTTSADLFVAPRTFSAGYWVLTLSVSNGGELSNATASAGVTIEPGSLPQVVILPFKPVLPGKKLRLFASTTRSSANTAPLTMQWELAAAAAPDVSLLVPENLRTKTTKKALVVRKDVLVPGVYTLGCIVTQGNLTSRVTRKVTVTGPPTACTCSVGPTTGAALNTAFHVECSGCVSAFLPLSYAIGVQSATSTTMLTPPSLLPSVDVELAPGTVFVVARVSDSRGATTTVTAGSVTVSAATVPSGPDGRARLVRAKMDAARRAGPVVAVAMAGVLAETLNVLQDGEEGDDLAARASILDGLTADFDALPSSEAMSVLETTLLKDVITKAAAGLKGPSLEHAVAGLRSATVRMESSEAAISDDAVTNVLASLTSLAAAVGSVTGPARALHTRSHPGAPCNIPAEDLSSGVVYTTNTLLTALARDVSCGEDVTQVEGSASGLAVVTLEIADLRGADVPVPGGATLALPTTLLPNITDMDVCVSVRAYAFASDVRGAAKCRDGALVEDVTATQVAAFSLFTEGGAAVTVAEEAVPLAISLPVVAADIIPGARRTCEFWNETLGGWSSKGCAYANVSTDELFVCHCDHLTLFSGQLGASCEDGHQNQGETGVDCGGPCIACPTCEDGILNQNETDVDCGGPCPPCPSCSDGVQNQNETGVDCGGLCPACPNCTDNVMNGDETGVDCGGSCVVCVPPLETPEEDTPWYRYFDRYNVPFFVVLIVAGVVFILIVLLCYCLCCRKKSKKLPPPPKSAEDEAAADDEGEKDDAVPAPPGDVEMGMVPADDDGATVSPVEKPVEEAAPEPKKEQQASAALKEAEGSDGFEQEAGDVAMEDIRLQGAERDDDGYSTKDDDKEDGKYTADWTTYDTSEGSALAPWLGPVDHHGGGGGEGGQGGGEYTSLNTESSAGSLDDHLMFAQGGAFTPRDQLVRE